MRGDVHAIDMSEKHVQVSDKNRHEFFCPRCGHCCREWVGLTDEEVQYIADSEYEETFVRLIEAKLKEKNT
jgi:uncharacterized cysteine cluster protein YcgN (CxxCxxCC family)